ncbi:hypothetical protein WN944_029167 [Citrus x changshan-huyou]|uniref:Retrotransposon gag domain-containing protein n=1 Tax=Citrus x changshan-huyou TaxID=2935761 RepID=A0AAP0LLU8_9ROSI
MTNTEKLETTIINFEGEALIWFGWENKRRPFLSWEELKSQLLLRFRSLPNGSIYEEFLALRQSGSVREYRRRFEQMASTLKDISE